MKLAAVTVIVIVTGLVFVFVCFQMWWLGLDRCWWCRCCFRQRASAA